MTCYDRSPVQFQRIAGALMIATVAACGGGGSDSTQTGSNPTLPPTATSPTTPVTPSTPVTTVTPVTPTIPTTPTTFPITITVIKQPPMPLQTSIPTPTYAAGSIELKVFTTLNRERSNCGAGLQAQNAQLDLAAFRHAEYLRLRWEEGIYASHTEDPLKAGYFAKTGPDRAAAAGYLGNSIGEELSFEYVDPENDVGDRLARNLLDTVYHLQNMYLYELDVGVAVSIAHPPGLPPLATLAWQPGSPFGKSQISAEDVLTYPCEGSTGVKTTFTGETPQPFAGVAMGTYTSLGHPIYVFSPAQSLMIVSAADLTSASGEVIPTFIYTKASDPHGRLLPSGNFVVPLAALQVNTKYAVQVRGTVDGKPFAKAFQFSTGGY